MKDLIKQLLRESLFTENQLEEGKFRNAVAGGLMGLGALAGGKAQAQDIQKTSPTEMSTPPTPEEAKYIEGAITNKFYKPIGDVEYNKGLVGFHHIPFFERPFIYTKLGDDTKIKIPTKEYNNFLRNQGR